MASLEGLPPLPKSLSSLNLLDFNTLKMKSHLYAVSSDKNILKSDGKFNPNSSLAHEDINVLNSNSRTYSLGSSISSKTNIVNIARTSIQLREETSSLPFKEIPHTLPLSSLRISPVVNISKNTLHCSSRGNSNIVRGSSPPLFAPRSATSPKSGVKNIILPSMSPRQNQDLLETTNGLELVLHSKPECLFNLDSQLAVLRKEMFSLRQMDLSLLNQLWSLNEAIQDFRHMQEENALTFPPSPGSCEDSDEFYSPISSSSRYQNISNFQLPSFGGRFSTSSSESSVEYGDV